MTWHSAPSVVAALAEATRRWPDRSKASDGTIGDSAHAARKSDHNPDAHGTVHAFDLTHDPSHGVDCQVLADHLVDGRDTRVKYVIWNKRICSAPAWQWIAYHGKNPHTKHMHVSVKATAEAEQDTSPWWQLKRPAPAKILSDIRARRQSIIHNSPGVFLVAANAAAASYANPWYSISAFQEVSKNEHSITREARRHALNPNYVRAIIWLESTHGYYDRLDPFNHTIRPMNVHATLWAELGANRHTLSNPAKNIEIGTLILARIWNRVHDRTFDNAATLYNALGASHVSGYGKTAMHYALTRPWKKK